MSKQCAPSSNRSKGANAVRCAHKCASEEKGLRNSMHVTGVSCRAPLVCCRSGRQAAQACAPLSNSAAPRVVAGTTSPCRQARNRFQRTEQLRRLRWYGTRVGFGATSRGPRGPLVGVASVPPLVRGCHAVKSAPPCSTPRPSQRACTVRHGPLAASRAPPRALVEPGQGRAVTLATPSVAAPPQQTHGHRSRRAAALPAPRS